MTVSVDLEPAGDDYLLILTQCEPVMLCHHWFDVLASGMLTYRAGRLMDQQWNINGAPDSIRGIVRTIVGDSKPGYLVAHSGGTDAALDSSKPGGFYSCFPDPVAWNQLYMHGLGSSPYIDVFWKACSDAGVEFSPLGVAGYDEDLDRPLSTNQAFDELVRRIHFHWFYSNSSGYDVATPADEWAIRLSVPVGLTLANSRMGSSSYEQRTNLRQPICGFGRRS